MISTKRNRNTDDSTRLPKIARIHSQLDIHTMLSVSAAPVAETKVPLDAKVSMEAKVAVEAKSSERPLVAGAASAPIPTHALVAKLSKPIQRFPFQEEFKIRKAKKPIIDAGIELLTAELTGLSLKKSSSF